MATITTRALVAHIGEALDSERLAKLRAGATNDSPLVQSLLTMRGVVEETPTEHESPDEWLELFFAYADSHMKQHAHDDSYGGGPEAMKWALGHVETTAHALGFRVATRH